jgi:RNA polymerase sigma-70 factor (ECF subfamily)
VEISLNFKPQLKRFSSGPVDTALLIRQAQTGDVGSFEALVSIYQERVLTLSHYLTGNHADAQDLAQEVFVKAYLNLKNFRREADLGTWLHRITINLWSNMQRRQKLSNPISLDDPVQTEAGEFTRNVAATHQDGDPQGVLDDKELSDQVQQALRQLPEEWRLVLVLREIEGYSYEEIASITKCSLGTVKSRLNRARQAMREKIAGGIRPS